MVSLKSTKLCITLLSQYILDLTGYLKLLSPIMYRIYLAMKTHPQDEITP